jgi:uncharacterized protein (UPF0332 family)
LDHLSWCIGVKNGVTLVEPSVNLSRVYVVKAEEALDAMESVRPRNWKFSTGYYALYFALYSVMMRVGIRSEIHTCSIEVMRSVLSSYFNAKDVSMVERAQKARVEAQYYSSHEIPDPFLEELCRFCPRFVVHCKRIGEQLTESDILSLREALLRSRESQGKEGEHPASRR